jgi:hypothetical protein
MPSSAEQPAAGKTASRRLADAFEVWNRKLHFYTGLYLLFFLWLFSFTGLLLNHPGWTFAQFWPNRKQSDIERPIKPPPPGGDLAQARDILRQLGIDGEIGWTTTRPDLARFDFRVSRPGRTFEIRADLQRNVAAVHRIDLNGWGVMHILHTFTGVRMTDSMNSRDWALTTVWALSMDVLSAGLILMVLSSLSMWWRLKQKRRLGALALGLGLLSCGPFVIGFRWLW